MANTQAPFGFRPVRRVDAAAVTFAMDTRQISSADTTAIGYGDVVKAATTGFITRATAADNALADPGIYGIFYGCEYYDTALQRKIFSANWTGVTTALANSIMAKVIIDPKVVLECQVGGSTTGIVLADVGANIGILNGTIGATGISTQGIDQTTVNTTITLPFTIIGQSQKIGNDNTSAYNTVEVLLNNSRFNSRTGF